MLGHDTHGHAEASTTGCSGSLPTDATDVAHGGNVFGVISATYTDHGVAHDNVRRLTTTAQAQIRQKHQEVEFVVSQSGTNTATNNDGGPGPPGGPGVHRGSLADGDWIQLNGPFNLVNITSITYRVADAARRPHRRQSRWRRSRSARTRSPGRSCRPTTSSRPASAATWTSQNFPISLCGHPRALPRLPCRDRRRDRRQSVQPQLGRVPGRRRRNLDTRPMELGDWIEGYRRAWEQNDADLLLTLFTEDASYRSSPFREPNLGWKAASPTASTSSISSMSTSAWIVRET